jgi:anti-anti-sigma factor
VTTVEASHLLGGDVTISMTPLHLHTQIHDGRVTVTVIGELDAHTAPSFAAFVDGVPVRPDVIDARYVSFVDALGLRVLLAERDRRNCHLQPSLVVERLAAATGAYLPPADGSLGPPRLDDADFAVAIHDTDLRFHYVNPRLARINGVPADRHTGRLPPEVFDVETDDVTEVLRDVLSRRAPATVTVTGATATGASGCWTCNYYPVRWMLRDDVIRQIVAVVIPTTPTDTALAIEFSAPSRPGE